MVQTYEGERVVGDAMKIAVVVARFNDYITERLLAGAIDAYRRHGGNPDDLHVAHVPGSFELGSTARKFADSGYDAVVCLGCVIRGETDHYDQVVMGATEGVARVGAETGVPTIFGVITVSSMEQAIDRAGGKQGNLGASAMVSAIEMVNLGRKLD
ncbi:MAG: 6,7-dimethyl-8-ribityllumazine synthase [Phycisphaeraceae bacterium]|nr:6,7-dimethyl-8-ribityllumazine synthase [Phycisphaeraceae bacterium]